MTEADQTTMEAILIRDQRTTSNWIFNITDHTPASFLLLESTMYQKNTSHSYPLRTKKNSYASNLQSLSYHVPKFHDNWGIRLSSKASVNTWLRHSVFLLALFATSVLSAPRMSSIKNDSRMNSTPRWINPCGFSLDPAGFDPDAAQATPEPILLTYVTTASQTAITSTHGFLYDYVRDNFHIDFDDLHKTWKDTHYDWLPGPDEIPKELGETLPDEYIKTIKFDNFLKEAYAFMQKYAVGIEQIIWDMEDIKDIDAMHEDQYKRIVVLQGGLLCEMQTVLYERGDSAQPDVCRDIMPSDIRNPASVTHRNLRDWLILRDYYNAVQYVASVFIYFNNTNSLLEDNDNEGLKNAILQ